MTPSAAFRTRVRRLLRRIPKNPPTVARVYNAKGKHVADLVLSADGARRRRRPR